MLMKQLYDPVRQVYCIPRNRMFFELIVFYVNHGILSKPIDIPLVNPLKRIQIPPSDFLHQDLYMEELKYYFSDNEFLTNLKRIYDIPQLYETMEIRYLSQPGKKRFLWRAIEYNETLFGPFYRFFYGSVCLISIFLFLYEIIITRNEHFIAFTERYRGYVQNSIHPVNITVQFIDYRPQMTSWRFRSEILFSSLWTLELLVRVYSAPNIRFYIKSALFWIDIVNLLNTLVYILLGFAHNQQKELQTDYIKSVTLYFQMIDIFKTLRMIKLGRYHRSIKLIIESLGKASMEFLTLCIVLFGTACVFGTIIYTIERTTNPTSTVLFPNVGTSVYYTILAITNVGFEGFLPSTYLGKWMACAAITIGILSSALTLPLILSPYNRQLLMKTKTIIYRDEFDVELSHDDSDVKYTRRY
ncbi:unnamed protein product [Adineta ricciae]|uniref:Ion transport domain-containing protein n=1 Tax=Adineta ricciae TaxID=249248 RepID=A0A813XGR9_ADIRI|nr:unnamed protein product [Adineta ricciae]